MDTEQKKDEIAGLLKKQVRLQVWTLIGVGMLAGCAMLFTAFFILINLGFHFNRYGL